MGYGLENAFGHDELIQLNPVLLCYCEKGRGEERGAARRSAQSHSPVTCNDGFHA